MNTNLLIGLLISVAVAGGGGYLLYTSMQQEATVNVQTESETNEQTTRESNSISGTFASLLGLGQNLRCEFAFDDGTNVSNGTFFIADGGKQLRGDFNVIASAGGSMEGHLIRNGGFNYMWSSQMEQGVKMEIEEGEEDTLFGGDTNTVPVDEDTTYNCVPWSVDTSKFVVPSEIEFMDLGAQLEVMGNFQTSGTLDAESINAQQCGACNQIPDANAEAQCLAALSC